jgi:G3E family GTPase
MPRGRKKPIALTIVAGARGAGKTTLINRLLDLPPFARTAVILNDFGEVQLKRAAVATADEGYIALGSGCVCCVVRGALADALERLLRDLDNNRLAGVDRVVIEADAAADPGAIVAAVERHPYVSLRFVVDGIVAVVDASVADTILAERADAARQVAISDVVALSGGAASASVIAAKGLGTIVDAAMAPASAFIGHRAFEAASEDVEAWLAFSPSERHPAAGGEAARIRAFSVGRLGSLSIDAFDRFLDYLGALQGPNIIRLRAAANIGEGALVTAESIGDSFRPSVIAATSKADAIGIRFLVVARDLDAATLEGYLAAFLNEARVDSPDRQALTDNPLAIAGFSARRGR